MLIKVGYHKTSVLGKGTEKRGVSFEYCFQIGQETTSLSPPSFDLPDSLILINKNIL